MENYDNNLLDFPMWNLNKLGILCTNSKTSIKRKLFTTLFGSLMLFCIVTSFIQYFYIKDNNIFDIVDTTAAVAGYGQIFLKLCLSAYNKEKFINLIKILKQFWNTDNCSNELKEEVSTVVTTIKVFQKFLFYAMVGCAPIFSTSIFFGKDLPLGSWNMENQEKLYYVLLSGYIISLPFSLFFISSFDGVFLGLCYEAVIQFKILRYSFENLSVRNINSQEDFQVFYEQLRKHIQHHKFLLEFLNEMQEVYSVIFMMQYLTLSPLICTQLYAASESTSLPITLRFGFAVIALVTQLAFYCIPSSLIFEEAMLVSYGIYSSDWYSKYFRQIKFPMIMLIQASQKQLEFTACGLVPMSISTLLSVVNVAISASAMCKSLKD